MCLTLCTKAIQICRVQEQAKQWDNPPPDNPNMIALHATLQAHQQLFEALVTNPNISNSCYPNTSPWSQDHTYCQQCSYIPPWSWEKPKDPNEICMFNNCQWRFCSKCHQDGAWTSTHNMASHIIGYQCPNCITTATANLGLECSALLAGSCLPRTTP